MSSIKKLKKAQPHVKFLLGKPNAPGADPVVMPDEEEIRRRKRLEMARRSRTGRESTILSQSSESLGG